MYSKGTQRRHTVQVNSTHRFSVSESAGTKTPGGRCILMVMRGELSRLSHIPECRLPFRQSDNYQVVQSLQYTVQFLQSMTTEINMLISWCLEPFCCWLNCLSFQLISGMPFKEFFKCYANYHFDLRMSWLHSSGLGWKVTITAQSTIYNKTWLNQMNPQISFIVTITIFCETTFLPGTPRLRIKREAVSLHLCKYVWMVHLLSFVASPGCNSRTQALWIDWYWASGDCCPM